jgi:hypothetical protein
MFKAPFSFSGRITRKEYCLSWLVFFAAFILMGSAVSIGPAISLLMLPAFWFLAAQGWKRSQDAGWHGIVGLIPYVNFVLLFASGDEGRNAHGPNPKHTAEEAANSLAQETNTHSPQPLADAWERARSETGPEIQISSFKCGSCGAQNTNVEHTGSACCQFCGAPKG